MNYNSIWLKDIEEQRSPSLKKDKKVDVLIIGGGITGMSIAYELANSGLNICLVEKNIIGHVVTSRSTAKLTYLQETIYSDLTKYHSKDIAKKYLKSQIEAIRTVENIVKTNKIDCDFTKVSSYIFANNDKNIGKILKEKKILQSFGIKVSECRVLPNDLKCKKAIYLYSTAVFHPLKYLQGLKRIISNKIDIYENTKINKIRKENNTYICEAGNNKIVAKKVIIATHYPYFLKPYLFPLKSSLEKSYITAYKTNNNLSFSAITVGKPTESYRYHNNYEIYLSDSHNISFKNNIYNHYQNLTNRLKKEPEFFWSNKDIITIDKLPYIGRLKSELYIATGYNTWGMTNGVIAGKVIADLVLNKQNEYIELFNPHRSTGMLKIFKYILNIFNNTSSFIVSKIYKNKSYYKKVKFSKIGKDNVGIYIDENNKKHIVYNRCPHLKCGLIFNEIEKTWECPCHGSRFDIDGNCLEGPSNYNIKYK